MNPYTGLPYNQGNFNGITAPGAISVNDQIKESPAGNAASDFPTTPDEFIKSVPYYAVGAGAGFGIMKGINALCNQNGAYADSRLAKMAASIDGNKYVRSANDTIEGWIKTVKDYKDKKCGELPKDSSRRKIIDSIKEGTQPGNSLAKSQIHGVSGMAADHVVNELKSLKDSGKLAEKLSKQELEAVETILNNKNLSGLKAIDALEGALKDSGGLTELGQKFKDIKAPRTLKIPFIKDPIKLGEKTTNLNLSLNKFKGLEGTGAKTFVSSILQKAGLIAGEAASGTIIGGGAIGLVLSAFFLGGSLKKAMEAPKGEKVSTFMEEFMGNYFGFLVTMPLAMKALYKTAGLKNLGVDRNIGEVISKNSKFDKNIFKNRNLTIQQRIDDLMAPIKNDPKAVITKEAREEIKALKSLSGKGLPIIQKVSKFFGRVMGVGLEKLPALTKPQKIGNFLKGFGGGGLRFAVIMFAIAPILTKPFTWLSHAIFGTPTATKEAEKAEKAEQPANTQPTVNNNTQTSPFVAQNQNAAPTQAATANNSQEPARTYIPSPEPAVFQIQPDSNVANALNRSDSVMNYVNGVMQSSH